MTARASIRLAAACCALVASIAALSFAAEATSPDFVWIEGEDFAKTTIPNPRQPFPNDIKPAEKQILSGGKWLGTGGGEGEPAKPHTITYNVNCPTSTTWQFWVRKFWHHGPFRWRFDDGEWRTCERGRALSDTTFMRLHFGANWIFLGMADLAAGPHTLNIEMLQNGGAIDCFVLTQEPFVPRGKLKPNENAGTAWPGWFAWEPPADPLEDDCPIDMRHLNEAFAGEHGFVRRDGEKFRRGDGEELRFWMLQSGDIGALDQPLRDQAARRVAKYGFNLARLFCMGLFEAYAAGDKAKFADELDKLHKTVAAYKKAGVYTFLGHLFWHTAVTVSKEHGFESFDKPGKPIVSINVDPEFRTRFLEYLDLVLNATNTYTGLPLSQDPAVAFVEIQNESGLLFWTFRPSELAPRDLMLMEKLFGDWATKKYGSVDKALAAWGGKKYPKSPDTPAEGRLGLYGAGDLSGQDWAVNARNPKRASDQLQFLVELQYETYDTIAKAMRGKLGVKSLISASNWHTSDARVLEGLERYSNTPGDVLCRNTYYGPAYNPKPVRFHAVDLGDTFLGYSALKPPSSPKPLTCAHMQGYPYMITENCWEQPNPYRAEWPFLIAAYASLTGVDGWNFFSGSQGLWESEMGVWDVQTPVILGQSPAAALAYRMGYIEEAPPAVTEHLSFNDLYNFKGTALYPAEGTDMMWQERLGHANVASSSGAGVNPLAFYVGRVERWMTNGPSSIESVKLDDYIDLTNKVVRSLTRQVTWNYGKGVVTIDAPLVQGVCGFLKDAGAEKLSCLRVQSGNSYASIMAVPLDGKPLAESKRILVQAATEDLPYGFETKKKEDGYAEITAKGGYPLNVRDIDATIALLNTNVTRATVLDQNGYPTKRLAKSTRTDKGLRVTMPADSLYVLVE